MREHHEEMRRDSMDWICECCGGTFPTIHCLDHVFLDDAETPEMPVRSVYLCDRCFAGLGVLIDDFLDAE